MIVKLIAYTPEPEKVCATAMRSCRTLEPAHKLILRKPVEYYIRLAKKSGHLSTLEHAVFTFSVEGISRVTTHQLVRHRIASYSQQSMREVKPTDDEEWYVTPKSVKKIDIFSYEFGMAKIKEYYKRFIKLGIPIEDARYFLPNATKTNIVITMNARELRHYFSLRLSKYSQWEIRDMAKLMLEEVKKVAPVIFEDL